MVHAIACLDYRGWRVASPPAVIWSPFQGLCSLCIVAVEGLSKFAFTGCRENQAGVFVLWKCCFGVGVVFWGVRVEGGDFLVQL